MSFLPISAFFLLPAMLLLLEFGRRLRIRQRIPSGSAVIEGAIFAPFGLLLAFTFSGAAARYDTHRQLLVEETNDISTAYLEVEYPREGLIRFTYLDQGLIQLRNSMR
jgi:hypothetical protein